MEQLKPQTLIPGHGPVIFGEVRAAQVLRDGAEVLEHLDRETLALLNRGASLDEILRTVTVPAPYLAKPYLQPKYDDPEFLVRGIYHLYAGWFDGDPARLKPARRSEFSTEIAQLVGGAEKLAARAAALSERGEMRLAVQLAELARVTPDWRDRRIRASSAAVLEGRDRLRAVADGQAHRWCLPA